MSAECKRLLRKAGSLVEVNVIEHNFQRFAVWFGGSIMCLQPSFLGSFHTREQYGDIGPSIARHNAAFQAVT